MARVKAENKGDHNVIFWSTASEVNTDKFIVQRRHESEDEFTNIAEVKAAGLATNVSTYNATDADVEKGGFIITEFNNGIWMDTTPSARR